LFLGIAQAHQAAEKAKIAAEEARVAAERLAKAAQEQAGTFFQSSFFKYIFV